jgi:hypothetical protein
MSREITYWGISCRACNEAIAFDRGPYNKSGLGVKNAKPGAFRCIHGHNHIYYRRDFRFFSSDTQISDAIRRDNCRLYWAVNPSPQSYPEVEQVGSSSLQLVLDETGPQSLGSDAPREKAQEAATAVWSEWQARNKCRLR